MTERAFTLTMELDDHVRALEGTEALALLRYVQEHLEVNKRWSVQRCRRAGVGWAGIGRALGVSRQAVQQRYG